MRITIISIEAEIKNVSIIEKDVFTIAGWWVEYEVMFEIPHQIISAKLLWEHTPDIELIMEKIKELWKEMGK
jgi:hypothetical protein